LSFIDVPSRRFAAEFSAMIDKTVGVRTRDGREYTGKLVGYDSSTLSLVLSDAKDSEGREYPRLILYGRVVSEVFLVEAPLDLEELARRLEERFPKMVKYYPEARVIVVMDKIRVTERGVEGAGPIAQRVKDIFDEFVAKKRSG